MIQYMGTGVAVVSSPVGANAAIFEGSGAGALATTQQEWIAALSHLIEDASYRETCAQNAREHAVEKYSVKAVLPRYLEVLGRSEERRVGKGWRCGWSLGESEDRYKGRM